MGTDVNKISYCIGPRLSVCPTLSILEVGSGAGQRLRCYDTEREQCTRRFVFGSRNSILFIQNRTLCDLEEREVN